MRIRSLDGLRAVSILLVIAGHLTIVLSDTYPQARRALQLTTTWASNGVAVFFGISGFIITLLLLRERADTQRINLRAFYVRRAFRILPPLWTMLAILAMSPLAISTSDLGSALLFLTDYLPPQHWCVGHTWSLSVEEQFYLLWPVTLATLGLVGAGRVARALILISPIVRAVTLAVSPLASLNQFHLIADAVMVGCLVALLEHEQRDSRLLRVLRHDAMAALSAAYLLIGMALVPRWSRAANFDFVPYAMSVRSIAVASVLAWGIANPDRSIGRILNWSVLRHVGLVSYSLYLWQQIFLYPGLSDGLLTRWWPVRLVGAFLAAEMSYRMVERPALALRERWFGHRQPIAAPTLAMTSDLRKGD